MQSILPNVGVEKESITAWARKVMLLLKATENETQNFKKRGSSKKRIQFIVLNQYIEAMKLRGT